jgi:hypothetical protein
MSYVWRVLGVILLVIVALLPLHSDGTGDVAYWSDWIAIIERNGFIAGYNAVPFYPPMAWVILQGVALSYHALDIDVFLAVKWSLVIFLLLTSAIFLLWTRNLRLTAIFHLSLVLSSVALGYLDIWLAPTILLAFWALKERKIFLFSVCFTISCLIKQPPWLLAPFLMVYVVRQTGLTYWKASMAQWKTTLTVLLRDVVLPVGVMVGTMALVFGEGVLRSLEIAVSHANLSLNALNYNWLVTYYLRLTQPDRFGAMGGVGEIVDYISVTEWPPADWAIVVVPRILFALFYLGALLVFLRRSNSFDNLLRFTIVGYLAYCTFNIGVHENHLFLAPLLAFVLCWVNRRDLYTALILALMANINLFVFYGVVGGYPYNYGRLVGGIDISVPLALFNVIFFLLFWATTCWPPKPDSRVNIPESPGPKRADAVAS